MVEIANYVPYGHENAVRLSVLQKLTGEDGRECRRAINAFNKSGEGFIINLQDARGYFRPTQDEKDLVRKWRALHISRTRDEEDLIRRATKYLNENEDQMELFS